MNMAGNLFSFWIDVSLLFSNLVSPKSLENRKDKKTRQKGIDDHYDFEIIVQSI